jgi:hypothetical protein
LRTLPRHAWLYFFDTPLQVDKVCRNSGVDRKANPLEQVHEVVAFAKASLDQPAAVA